MPLVETRIQLHDRFWQGGPLERPLSGFRLGDYFFADKFRAAHPLLKPGLKIVPEMLAVDDFMEDYERLFREISEIGQEAFWTAEPFTGIPWMEAILGCPVYAGDYSFITEPAEEAELKQNEGFEAGEWLENNRWFQKYMEFTEKLVGLSNGRFPIGQPIMRGPSDMMGALLGQTRMVLDMFDEPEAMHALAGRVTQVFRRVVEEQFKRIPDFHGGHSIGFYHLWTPGRCIWFQEDLSSLLSPDGYRSFIKQQDENICRGYDYTAVHLHPASFHVLDDFLRIADLKAIEVNKDIGGPSIAEMLPVFNRILDAGKRLILWGALDETDIVLIRRHLPGRPIFMSIVAETPEKAKVLKSMIDGI